MGPLGHFDDNGVYSGCLLDSWETYSCSIVDDQMEKEIFLYEYWLGR